METKMLHILHITCNSATASIRAQRKEKRFLWWASRQRVTAPLCESQESSRRLGKELGQDFSPTCPRVRQPTHLPFMMALPARLKCSTSDLTQELSFQCSVYELKSLLPKEHTQPHSRVKASLYSLGNWCWRQRQGTKQAFRSLSRRLPRLLSMLHRPGLP